MGRGHGTVCRGASGRRAMDTGKVGSGVYCGGGGGRGGGGGV